jgi:hypothetical protein
MVEDKSTVLSFDEGTVGYLDVFTTICVDFDVAGLEDSSTVDGVKALSEEFGVQGDLAHLFLPIFLGNVLLVAVSFLAQFGALPHSAGQVLSSLFFLKDLFRLNPFLDLLVFFLEFILDFSQAIEFSVDLLLLGSGFGVELGCSFVLVAMSDFDLVQFGDRFDFSLDGPDFFIVDDPVLEFFDVHGLRVVGVTGFGSDDGRDLAGFVLVSAFEGGIPWVIDLVESMVSDDLIVVFRFGPGDCDFFEAIGV